MRLVTQVEEISRSRSRVYLEDGGVFLLYRGELRRFHIKEQEMISEEDYQSILTEILPKRAKLRAMHLLKSRDYTQKQLTDKLRRQDYPEPVIEEALSYVEEFRYIDDERYTRDYITGQLEKKSRRRIEEDLFRKGIDRELVSKIFREFDSEELHQAEQDHIRKLLEKKKYDPEKTGYEDRQKLMAFLCRKGYSPETVGEVLRSI